MNEPKKGLFRRFREGLRKTTRQLRDSVGGLFGSRKLDEATLESIEEALYGADFGVATTEEILAAIREAHRRDKELRGADAAAIGRKVLAGILEGAEGTLPWRDDPPTVVEILGVNGSGKTTTTAKLAAHYRAEGRQVLLGACDTFRAAAGEQLRTWAERVGADLVASQQGADAAAVAFDSFAAARKRGSDLLLLDTAGRLHTQSHLMEELKKVNRVLAKQREGTPDERWLVVDATLGANSLQQARLFHEAIGLTGLLVTKLDGSSRGGSLTAIYRELQLPIHFVGLGESADDLQPFRIADYTAAVFPVDAEGPEED
jgi:fused signal recognition particle receptor